jgi:hypothetical protein
MTLFGVLLIIVIVINGILWFKIWRTVSWYRRATKIKGCMSGLNVFILEPLLYLVPLANFLSCVFILVLLSDYLITFILLFVLIVLQLLLKDYLLFPFTPWINICIVLFTVCLRVSDFL